MARKTIADLEMEVRRLHSNYMGEKRKVEELEHEVDHLRLEIAKLETERGKDAGRAEAFDKCYERLVRHYELIHGSKESIRAIADEEARFAELARTKVY